MTPRARQDIFAGDMVGRSEMALQVPLQRDIRSPEPFGEVAKIYRPRRFNLEAVREAYRLACKEAVEIAFNDKSRHRICMQAHGKTGLDPDKFRRIMAKETLTPDPVLMGVVAGFYRMKTGKTCPAIALLNQLAGTTT